MSGCCRYAVWIALFASLANNSAGAAQSAGTPANASQQPSFVAPSTANEKKPKKVWTNDDISTGNEPAPAAAKTAKESPKKTPDGKPDAQYVANTRRQLEKLESQLKDVNQQIADLKAFQSGKPATTSSGYQLNKGYNRVPVDQQITNLEAKKKDIQAKIDDLLDEARKKGVEPGQLR